MAVEWIDLSITDKWNNQSKVKDLYNAVGKECLGYKLIQAGSKFCYLEKDGIVIKKPSWWVWNKFFF